ncbi:MAG: hypothetical protein ABIN08_08995, partial [Caldimonas sp.]
MKLLTLDDASQSAEAMAAKMNTLAEAAIVNLSSMLLPRTAVAGIFLLIPLVFGACANSAEERNARLKKWGEEADARAKKVEE